MRISEIRKRWLDYFASKGHHIAPSVPLISPDPSVLFTIAGVIPFTPYILGTDKAPWPSAASVQKCIRTLDIDEVGRTTRHGTFFQMGGNFSFGDYFKEGAIEMAHELLTSPLDGIGYGLDPERLWYTIWEKDAVSEATLRRLGVSEERIQKLPFEQIEWSTGQPGPAGSCCEIHYDRGPGYGPEGGPVVDTKGDRFLEVWNLVFDEFIRGEGEGASYPLVGKLEQTAIDTGLGIERLGFLLQGKENIYETDEVYPVIAAACELSGKRYGASESDDVHLRVVADHVRSALMLASDGVRPGNDGRGYVLRRIIRRAVRAMRLLGITDPVMPHLLPVSYQVMRDSYTELDATFEAVKDVVYAEEEAFRRTLSAGMTLLSSAISQARGASAQVSGADAFQLHDTYGFPIDLTLEIAAEEGVSVDAEGFRALMREQKERARADTLAKKAGMVDTAVFNEIRSKIGGPVTFVGYSDTTAEVQVAGVLVDGVPQAAVSAPAHVEVVLDVTPFYAEAGGQLADRGEIRTAAGAILRVDDVQAPVKGVSVHRGELIEGTLTLDDRGIAQIDLERRRQIAQAHSATHMVHKALHEFLGEQATQAGSENAPSRMRFDFRHSAAVPGDLLREIEQRVNERLVDNLDVTEASMSLDEARAAGAMALFGEKYGEKVRVVSIGGDWSKELCAGTHVARTGNIGRVDILGESSIGSGIRRIEALVGAGAYAKGAREAALLSQLSHLMGSQSEELPARLSQLLAKLKDSEKELARIRSEALLSRGEALAKSAARSGELLLVCQDVGEVSAADDLRSLALDIRGRLGEGGAVALLGVTGADAPRVAVVVALSATARASQLHAGQLVREACALLGGGGGGKDDVAQGGGTNLAARPEALRTLRELLEGTS